MPKERRITRRRMLRIAMGGASGVIAGTILQGREYGTGLLTERAIYADVLTRIWQLHRGGSDPATLRDAYSKFLLMINLNKTHPGSDLRGVQLYLWKKRGVFQTMVSRRYGRGRLNIDARGTTEIVNIIRFAGPTSSKSIILFPILRGRGSARLFKPLRTKTGL